MQSNITKSGRALTTGSLRALMLEEINLLRDGKSTPDRLRAIAAGANVIVRTVALEIGVKRFLAPKADDGELFGTLSLVEDGISATPKKLAA